MVGSSGGKMIINSGKWPCRVCGKGVQTNTVKCKASKRGIYKQCSGVCGDSSLVVDCFRCKLCDGSAKEADMA